MLLTAVLLTVSPATAQNRVLFIGNSYTMAVSWGGTVSVATMFDALAQAGGHPDPEVTLRGQPGEDFEYHATSSTTLNAIKSDEWTHVVLQNYSTEPTHLYPNGGKHLAKHYTYGKQLYDQIMDNNPATQVVLYETWARHARHSLITGTSSPTSFESTTEMMNELRHHYAALADQLNAAHPDNPPVFVSPVGSAWEHAGGNLEPTDPGYVDLFNDPTDYFHGDDDGYYLAACVIYATIYERSPVGLSDSPLISALSLDLDEDPHQLETAAWETVLERYGVEPPTLSITRNEADQLILEWSSGRLQWAESLDEEWTDFDPQPLSPFTNSFSGGKRFYRLQYQTLELP